MIKADHFVPVVLDIFIQYDGTDLSFCAMQSASSVVIVSKAA